MRSVTWNRSETVRESESEEAAVRDCFFFFIFSEGRTYSPPAKQTVVPSRWSGRALLPKALLSPEGADNAASRHCLSSGELSCNSHCMKPCTAGFRVRCGNGAPFHIAIKSFEPIYITVG